MSEQPAVPDIVAELRDFCGLWQEESHECIESSAATEIEHLRGEVRRLESGMWRGDTLAKLQSERARQAEAERDRLREALREVEFIPLFGIRVCPKCSASPDDVPSSPHTERCSIGRALAEKGE